MVEENIKAWNDKGHECVPLVEVVELLTPCILHLENRIGEKIITIILRKGLHSYQGEKQEYIYMIQDTFWTKILGLDASPSHWCLYLL